MLEQLREAIEMTKAFCMSHDVDLSKVIENGDTFKNLSLFEDYANILVGNEDLRSEFAVMAKYRRRPLRITAVGCFQDEF